jgi:thymidylate kinase
MIILLTGPTGSGKTDTSWALLQQLAKIIFLDCDWFASRVPFQWENEADVESVYQSLSLMIEFHINHGEKNFVITLTYEMAILFEKFKTYFSKHPYPIKAFRLRCSEQELERRIRGRDRILWQKQQELNSMLNMQEDFDNSFKDEELFKLIDTTKLSEREVAMLIVSLTNT